MQAAATSTATPGANPARAAAAAVDAPCVLAEKARQRGNDMYRDGMWDQAVQFYRLAALLAPGSKQAHANQAAACVQLQLWDEAAAAASQAYAGTGKPNLAYNEMKAVAAALPQDRQVQAELQKLQKAADEGSRVQRAPPLQASQANQRCWYE
ncbi:hypothetical protein CHLNCDRAFT_138720 [Chlorella variabilis]|uniref:Uncharacterized protein n=1 Tax=Chlorella variabilis TaxID=554065 RepID=E1ZNM1_CHLVA|nr:hypothetical protein CHLNCDRAFT_138720 [Chlorella variabilis]EFN52629.1 hypothetical protein CHLNCDRAFT_138720 [Chlorella variabilis]|eukprot:XP_005844731.1 hypothetical protein CHLNCDRAFT_138720 [Chlorella variabilis]